MRTFHLRATTPLKALTMTDPLSIAAGVVGILSAASQLSSLLIKFTKSVKEAPQQARIIIAELSDTTGILSHLQSFLLGYEFTDRSRTSLLKVDQVVTIVSGCVLTFSELEKLLDDMKVEGMFMLDCMKWARKESDIARLIQRLQNHKASLSLMLNILNGNTIAEAKDSVDRLYRLVENCYQEMSSRVQALEEREFLRRDASTLGPFDNGTESVRTINGYNFAPETSPATAHDSLSFDFTPALQASWVYRRSGAFRASTYSLSTRDAYSTSWSCLSGLSMADISNISVINLAVSTEEVFNYRHASQTWSNNREPLSLAPVSATSLRSQASAIFDWCRGCRGLLLEERIFELGGNQWHMECLYCRICGASTDSDATFRLRTDDLLVCNTCGSRCICCGTRIESSLSMVVLNHAFCNTCFSCQACKKRKENLLYLPSSKTLRCTRCPFGTTTGTQYGHMYVDSPIQVYQLLEFQSLGPTQPRRRSTWLTRSTSSASSKKSGSLANDDQDLTGEECRPSVGDLTRAMSTSTCSTESILSADDHPELVE